MKRSGISDPSRRLNITPSGSGQSPEPVIEMEFCDPVPVSSLRRKKKDPEGPGFFETLFMTLLKLGIAGAVIYAGLLLVPKPLYPLNESKVYYTPTDILRMSQLDSGSEEEQKYLLDYYSIDLSRLYGAAYPDTQDIEAVNRRCRNVNTPDSLFPMRGHDLYEDITRYVTCIMTNQVRRFCASRERRRLVSQLKAYSQFRQVLLGIERSDSDNYFTRKDKGFLPGRLDKGKTFSIGQKMDRRVLDALSGLVEKGYVTAADFSFMGLFPSADYAPALRLKAKAVPAACGG